MLNGNLPGRGINPMIRVQSLDELAQADEARRPASDTLPTIESESMLSSHIRKAWERNKQAKEKVTQHLLASLRAKRGVYSANEIAQLQARGALNIIWVDLIATKCRAAASWMREVLMPVNDMPFQFDSTPVPDLPAPVVETIVEKAAREAQETMRRIASGGGGVLDIDEFRTMASEIRESMEEKVKARQRAAAQKAAEGMTKKISDHAIEGGWNQALDAFIEEFVTYPAAIMKGPVYERANRLMWGPGFTPQIDRKPQMRWRSVSAFDCYPSQNSSDCQTGDFIERVRYQRRELFDCIGLEDYREDDIRKALAEYRNGHLEGWLWHEGERAQLEKETLFGWLSPHGVIDALHYWGSVPGWMLMSWGVRGMEDLDAVEEYEVDAILIGRYVIRCAINRDPLKRRPYFKASFDDVPGAFWGRSVPDLAETCQKMVNAGAIALADNMGWASGPQAWVHVDRLADGENAVEVMPLKVWQLKSDPTQGVNPGVGFFQAESNAKELMELIERWEIKADDATGVPRYVYGNERVAGAADTFSGLSLLMNNAAKGLRRAIGHVDLGVIEPSMYRAFIFEMLYGKDRSIKCDANVAPKGATGLLIKEARNQAVLQALTLTANEIDMAIIGAKGRANILRKALGEALEISTDGIVPSDEEIDEQAKQQQDMAAQQMQIEAQARADETSGKLEVEREKISSNERIEGAKIAAQAKLAASKRTQGFDFEYDQEGNVKAMNARHEPAQEPPAEARPLPVGE